jgi:acetyl-CoA carboxylase carboxyl transferase subunit alpha
LIKRYVRAEFAAAKPRGAAHCDPEEMLKRLTLALRAELDGLAALSPAELRREREEIFLRQG